MPGGGGLLGGGGSPMGGMKMPFGQGIKPGLGGQPMGGAVMPKMPMGQMKPIGGIGSPGMPTPGGPGGMQRPQMPAAALGPQSGQMRMPQQNNIMNQMPDLIHKNLNTPEAISITKNLSTNLQNQVKGVASTSPAQAIQQAMQRSQGIQAAGPQIAQNGPPTSLQGQLSNLGDRLGLGNTQNRTQGILGGAIANPYLGANATDVPTQSTLGRINQMQQAQGLPVTNMSNYTPYQNFVPSAGPRMGSGFTPHTPQMSNNPSGMGLNTELQSSLPVIPKQLGMTPQNIPQLGDKMGRSDIGDLAVSYEVEQVKNRPLPDQVGFISTGMGGKDPGGISYGPYQLETNKGTMQGYLKSDSLFAKELSQYKINSPEFKTKWKELARKDPEGFKESQFDYLSNKSNGYNSALNHATKLGWATDNKALQSAIYSTANQSGGWKKGIFDKAGIQPSDDLPTQINKLYDARANYFKSLRSIPADVRSGILHKRTVLERQDALGMLGS